MISLANSALYHLRAIFGGTTATCDHIKIL
jgi:hypothetical protein